MATTKFRKAIKDAAAIDNAVRLIQTYEPANIEMALRSLNACNIHSAASRVPTNPEWSRMWNALTELTVYAITIYHGAPVFPGVYEHVRGGMITANIPVYTKKNGGFSPVRCRVQFSCSDLLRLIASPSDWKEILREISGVLVMLAAQANTPEDWKPCSGEYSKK